jgi:nucleoside-triphosphatase THEP1
MQVIATKPLREIWLKASVLGSIWASVEIILGSFLHNLKIPFSGMILSLIGVWLIISFLQVWKENGLVIRAGIICAIMKSISPSAIIFGPMIGIFTEALLIEFFIFIFGKNLVGYLFAGAFAVLSTLLHKLVSLLILYGFDFLKILNDLYQFAVKQINLKELSPMVLLLVITIIYIAIGFTGAVAGYLSGLKHAHVKKLPSENTGVLLQFKNQLADQSAGQNYSLFLLILNIVIIILILFLINYNYSISAIILGLIYISFCVFKYRNSLKRLRKVSFWLSFIIITFAAAFLWNGFSHGAFFSQDGLIVGLKMNARAIIIILGFSGISVELKNPLIKSMLYNRGFASLYQSLNLAFSALPFIISNLSKQGSSSSTGISRKSLSGLFSQADILLHIFENEHSMRPEIVIITGDIGQGKTTIAQMVVNTLRERNIKVKGFLSVGINDNGVRTGFNLIDIESSEEIELCSIVKDNLRFRIGKYYFNNEAIAKGLHILDTENSEGSQLIVIDEIGPLELSNKGWSGAIEKICKSSTLPQLWVVRENIINKIVRKWNIGNAYVFDIGKDDIGDLSKKIIELISQTS